MGEMLGVADGVQKNWDLDVKHVQAHLSEKETKALTEVQKLVLEGN